MDLAIGEDLCFLIDYALLIDRAVCTDKKLYYYLLNPNGAMSENRNALQTKHLTEWDAINSAAKKLNKHGISTVSLDVKRIRIADKLLSHPDARKAVPAELRTELKSFLRSHLPAAFHSDEFSVFRKAGITMSAFIPGVKQLIKQIRQR